MAKNFNKNIIKYLGFLLLVPSLILNLFIFQKYQGEREKNMVLVTDVLDGDTFVTSDGEKMRLLNVNAPELELCGGEEAKKRLEELIKNEKVSIERVSTDVYERSLVMLYTGGELVNRTLIAEGWGVYGARKIPESEEFKKLQKKAKEEKLGIFGPECYQKENLDNPKCNIKGNINRNTKTKFYHFPGCTAYVPAIIEKFNGDQWFCSEKEAQKAGFVKSEGCFGKKYNL
ncbi:hypothetical protein COT75_00105 [Candidatus Beckwithbacteria bacterium CG10_big_fil_rev_8_21_14_0_10_34_10]|uniref:TNase-like domain-containing protein n=1 Tax=Candidatus Beckwithbacteria bacterium CG10_big_fil_rev_8_21_14_0_10_34_10 TaxID=1974495 RepID=A0A2H0WAA3_9BACT|nr:MAG: hypothetical protein COT75_00105 [Candidatus Beckwithbacteria bacterium CG10_big_fil_rev_8_21_14_0_10_34_10]